jgi:hypothetical protein
LKGHTKAHEILPNSLGEKHPNTVTSLSNIGARRRVWKTSREAGIQERVIKILIRNTSP